MDRQSDPDFLVATPLEPWPPTWRHFASLALALLALALRLRGLDDQPLWFDEVLTLNRVSLPFLDMVQDALRNMQFPTYYALVGVFGPFGDGSTWALRLPSAVFGALTAAMAVSAGRLAGGGVWSGVVAGLLVALAPFQVEYGQEARAYTLLEFLITVALWGLLRLLAEPEAAARPLWRRAPVPWAWAAWGGGTAGALVVMNAAVPWLVVSIASLAVLVRAGRSGQRRVLLGNAALALAGVLVVWLPWVPFMSRAVSVVLAHGRWVPPVTLDMVWRSVSAVFLFGLVDPVGFEPVPLALPFPALLMAVAAGGGAWRLGSRCPRVLIALLLPVVALPVGLALASLVAPILIPRYVLWAGVPFFLLAATAMGTLRQRLRPLATAAVLVLGLWNLEPYYHAEVKPHWVPALKAVWAAAGPCDALFLDRDTLHYAASILERLSTDPSPKPERLGAPVQVQQALAAGRRVWVIQGPLTWLPEGALEEDAAKFAEFGAPTLVQPFGKAVVIERFDPPVPVCDSRIIGDSAPAGQCRVL